MKYIKYFDEHDVYTSYITNTPFLPNLSYCEDLDHLHLNKSSDSGDPCGRNATRPPALPLRSAEG